MLIKRKVKFILHKRKKDQTEDLGIRMRVTLKSQAPFDIPLGFNINEDQWDKDDQRALSSAPEVKYINRTIDEWSNILDDIFTRYEVLEKRIPTALEVRELFNDSIGRESKASIVKLIEKEDDFFNVFQKFIQTESVKNQWSLATQKKFKSVIKHIKDYNADLKLSRINEQVMSEIQSYLTKKGLVNTTVSKYISYLKWFLRWAKDNGHSVGEATKYKPKLKGTSIESKEIIYLTLEELKRIEEYQFSPLQKSLECVRDTFVFCCYTGLRYSDVEQLKKSDIKNGSIKITTKKTSDSLVIELNAHSQAILEKYKNVKTKNNKAIPTLSNVKANLYLKTIGQLCNINDEMRIIYYQGSERHDEIAPKWSVLTTHVARRTFVVTALQLGIPAEVIMKWTGHKDYESMKPYVAIVDKLKKESMLKFDTI